MVPHTGTGTGVRTRAATAKTARRGHVVALVLAVLLGACTAGPDYHAPRDPAPTTWAAPRPAGDPTAVTDPAALATWWRHFDDATLQRMVERALAANPDVDAARAGLGEARAARAQSGAGWYPAVRASATRSDSRGNDSFGADRTNRLYQAGFDASWELDLFGGVRRANEAAQAELEAAHADLHAVRVSLAAETALEYVNLRRLQEQLRIARRNLETQSDTARIAGWRATAGLASALDAEQAAAAREQTRTRVAELETTLAQARHRLSTLLAEPPGADAADLETTAPVPLPA